MDAKERADKIDWHIYNHTFDTAEQRVTWVAAQIEEAEREASEKWHNEAIALERRLLETDRAFVGINKKAFEHGYAEGFNAAKEAKECSHCSGVLQAYQMKYCRGCLCRCHESTYKESYEQGFHAAREKAKLYESGCAYGCNPSVGHVALCPYVHTDSAIRALKEKP